MDDLNIVALVGRATADPELRQTGGGTPVCSLRLAFNTSTKGRDGWEDKGNFINVTVWGTQGESVAKYVSRGSRVAVHGRLEYREWEDRDDNKRSQIEVVAQRVQFLETRSDPERSNSSRESTSSSSQQKRSNEDIPF